MKTIKIKDVTEFWSNSSWITGEIVKIQNGSITVYDETDECYYWFPKFMAQCNKTLKLNDEVEIELVSDTAAHRVYINNDSVKPYTQRWVDFELKTYRMIGYNK